MAPMVVNFAPAPPAQQETFQHLVPTQRGINLSMLIDFLLQKTYHDLTVLSELLPRKSDIDRKIEIIQFATKARQQFIRMLALVKWASTADRVDKCQAISSYLDQQNAYFIDTADTLARIARETLVQARLPNFSLPTAVDVLTTGTFNRLPKCIKTKIIPDEPISADDKARTLKRLNEVIQHRLVISNIPQQFTTIRINDGKVRLKVENEFEVVLMLMGDEKSIPWRLLNIEFLMEDYQTGDGKALVHGMQVHYIHQIVQSRLMADEDPLVDLYKTLRYVYIYENIFNYNNSVIVDIFIQYFLSSTCGNSSLSAKLSCCKDFNLTAHDVDYFCLSLQLEILHTQAKRLIGQRWGEYVSVDQYVPGKKLSISFCRCLLASASAAVKASPPSLTVEATADYSSLIVNLQSDPQSDTSESGAIKLSCSCLSIEKIYSVIFKQYSASKLHQLLEQLQKKPFYMSSCRLDDAMPCITIKPYECGAGENVLITIDSRSGLFLLKVNENIKPSLIQQLQDILQSDLEAFTEGFHQLRCHLFLERNKRSVMLLPVHIYDHLPITNLESHALSTFPKTKIFLHFKRHPGYCLVSTVDVSSDDDKNIVENYYLIKLHSNVANTDQGNTSRNTTDGNIGLNATFFYFAEVPIKLKTNAFSRPNVIQKDELSILFGLKKRKKLLDQEETDVTNKKTNFAMTATPIQKEKDASSPFNKSLSNMVTESYLRIPYIKVTKQLSDAKVVFDGVVMEDDSNYVVHLLDIPLLENCRQDVQLMLKKLLLKASVSYDHEVNNWVVGYSFSRPSITCARQLLCEDVVFTYDENSECTIASLILSGWKELVKMYQQAHDVDAVVKASAQYFTLENLSLLKYDMKSLLFSYCKDYMVSFTYDGLNNKYAIHFLENGLTRGKCPHNLTKAQLAQEFNTHEDIQYTLKIIHDTYAPLNSISKISILPALGISNRVLSVVNNFTIISHSSTRVKIIYRNVYTLDVYFMESTVLLRDGTYYRTDSTKAMRGFTTIPQLTNFLRLYADKAFANSLLVGYDFPFTPGASELDHQSEHFAPPSYDSSLKEKSVRSPAVVMSSPQTLGNTHFTAPSPGNPYNVASPGPFLQPSPAQVTMSPSPWPGSPPLVPGSPRPVKHGLNQLSSINVSHAPIPVVLTHAAFNMLLKPVKHDKSSPVRNPMKLSPLERFFGSTVLHTHLLRVLRTDDTLKLEKKEHGVVIFSGTGKNGPETGLQYSIRLNPSAMDFLILRITPIKGYENAWIPDELKVLEQFFEMKVSKEVVCSPYKVCALTAFARILGTQPKIMKDFIKIMKLELQTDWTDYAFRVEWCLTVPPGDVPSLALPGTPAVVLKAKNLIFLQLTEVKNEEHTVTITLVHDLKTNLVHNLEFPRQPNAPPEPITWAVRAKSALQVLLSKIAEHISKKESPIYCVVVTILKHLQVK